MGDVLSAAHNRYTPDAVMRKQRTWALVIISPETAMGIAGGQLTVGAAQMRPSASSTDTVSAGAKIASRTRMAVCAAGRRQENAPSAVCAPERGKGQSPSAQISLSSSCPVVSTDGIMTRYSRSAYSQTMPSRRRFSFSLVPGQSRDGARRVSFMGFRILHIPAVGAQCCPYCGNLSCPFRKRIAEPVRQVSVAQIQRCQQQVGGAGRTEQSQSIPAHRRRTVAVPCGRRAGKRFRSVQGAFYARNHSINPPPTRWGACPPGGIAGRRRGRCPQGEGRPRHGRPRRSRGRGGDCPDSPAM